MERVFFGVSCYMRAIAPATVPSLSQRIGVCGSGGHKQPYYVSGSKCYNLFVLASVVGIWKGMNESRCFCVRLCFSFCCRCAARQECALSFSFALSFLAFICVLRLCGIPLLIGSNIILS